MVEYIVYSGSQSNKPREAMVYSEFITVEEVLGNHDFLRLIALLYSSELAAAFVIAISSSLLLLRLMLVFLDCETTD